MRSRFDEQLEYLNHSLMEIGAYCESGIETAAEMLSSGNKKTVTEIRSINHQVRQLEREVENQCIRLFLQQQPVAGDLRNISAALKMVTDLERISEQAMDIGNIIAKSPDYRIPEYKKINEMADAAIKMVKESIEAYIKKDAGLAERVVESDDIVDYAFSYIKRDLIRLIAEEPEKGEPALDLLMIAKYLEGIGDHAVNVAQWVRYGLLGAMPEDTVREIPED